MKKNQINQDEIKEFRANLDGSELNVIISMVLNYSPQYNNKLYYFARSLHIIIEEILEVDIDIK